MLLFCSTNCQFVPENRLHFFDSSFHRSVGWVEREKMKGYTSKMRQFSSVIRPLKERE